MVLTKSMGVAYVHIGACIAISAVIALVDVPSSCSSIYEVVNILAHWIPGSVLVIVSLGIGH